MLLEGVKNLRLIALTMLCLLISCGVERPRYESPVPLNESKPTGQGICPVRKRVQEANWNCFSPSRGVGKCKFVGCKSKPLSVDNFCKQLRSKYETAGRVEWGRFNLVKFNEEPAQGDSGGWWPTHVIGTVMPTDVCYEGIQIETTSSKILRSIRGNSSKD